LRRGIPVYKRSDEWANIQFPALKIPFGMHLFTRTNLTNLYQALIILLVKAFGNLPIGWGGWFAIKQSYKEKKYG
jgi:hypothetical protein